MDRKPSRRELNRAIDEIAAIAGIETAHVLMGTWRSNLRSYIRLTVEVECDRPGEDFFHEFFAIDDEWTARLRTAFKVRGSLKKAAVGMQAVIKDYDEARGKRDRMAEIAPAPIDRILRELFAWADRKPPVGGPPPRSLSLALQKGNSRTRGRPRGGFERPNLVEFAAMLLFYVRVFGGKLTYDAHWPEKSTLIKALNLLRSHLPAGFLPKNFSARALQHAQALANNPSDFLHWYNRNPNVIHDKMIKEAERRLRNRKSTHKRQGK